VLIVALRILSAAIVLMLKCWLN